MWGFFSTEIHGIRTSTIITISRRVFQKSTTRVHVGLVILSMVKKFQRGNLLVHLSLEIKLFSFSGQVTMAHHGALQVSLCKVLSPVRNHLFIQVYVGLLNECST